MCKHSDVFSLAVLIGRGLDHIILWSSHLSLSSSASPHFVQFSGYNLTVGVDYREGPPVPIPNTEVKLVCADDSAWVTGCENR